MRLLIPYASVYLIDAAITHHDHALGIRADFSYGRRIKIRKAAPGASGIPHWDVKVRLFPKDDTLRKFSWGSDRRINGVCWHGHAQFMARMFNDFPTMTLRSAILGGRNQEQFGGGYFGIDDFTAKYRSTGDWMMNIRSGCHCPIETTGVRYAPIG